jgi:2-hydroxychromene-2-carboxylate isomerase
VGKRVDFIFDLMSPYAFLASTQLDAIAKRTGATFEWCPIFLPGLMKAVDNRGPLEVPIKARYVFKDVADWAKHYGLPQMHVPEERPFHALWAQRAFVAAAEQEKGPAFAAAMWRLIWFERQPMKDEAVIARALTSAGLDATAALARSKTDEVKAKLKANTDAAAERNVFGVPTFFVDGEMFVGNDRLMFVEKALCR